MKNKRYHFVRNIENINERNYSVVDLFTFIFDCKNKPNTLLASGNYEFLNQVLLNNGIHTVDISSNMDALNNQEKIKSPYVLLLQDENTTIASLKQYENLFSSTMDIVLKIPLKFINENKNFFSDLNEYLNSNNFSLLEIFGGYSSHNWQPDNMFGKIYLVFLNNSFKS